MWYSLAAYDGDKELANNPAQWYVGYLVEMSMEARRKRDFIAVEMTPQQIAKAQQLARECQARKFKSC